jgi:hypothetical protein
MNSIFKAKLTPQSWMIGFDASYDSPPPREHKKRAAGPDKSEDEAKRVVEAAKLSSLSKLVEQRDARIRARVVKNMDEMEAKISRKLEKRMDENTDMIMEHIAQVLYVLVVYRWCIVIYGLLFHVFVVV